MACLSENQIVEFFSPGRSSAIAAAVDAHAASCEKCRRLLAEYAHLAASTAPSLASVPSLTPSSSDSARQDRVELVQRLAQAQARKYIGTVLKGKWEIEELIGTGGMAHVFAARHRNGRRVAIKCMRPELMLERSLVERFLREGYVANKIEHPGAVAILDDDVMEDGTPFLVMELLVGRTLRERLGGGPLALDDALKAIAQVLDLLAVAHDKGIVHRDLKPDNLFETESGSIKVLDFGIARLKERTRPDFETRSGLTMGTVGYMPPEQARGLAAQVDARSDVWAMGATLFSLITGRRIHEEAATTNEALLLAMTSAVPPMSTLLPSLPSTVQHLLDTSLAFDKERRFATARAMKEALDAAMIGIENTVVVLPSKPPAPTSAFTPAGEATLPLHARARVDAGAALPHAAVAMTELAPANATARMLDRGVVTPKNIAQLSNAKETSPTRRSWLFRGGLVGGVGLTVAAIVIATTHKTPEPIRSADPPVIADPTTSSLSTVALPALSMSANASANDIDAAIAASPPSLSSASPSSSVAIVRAESSSSLTSLTSSSKRTNPAKPRIPPRPASSRVGTTTASPPPLEAAPIDTRDPLGPQH